MYKIDLTNPNYAYMFGLFQTDANFSEQSRNRGKLALEISLKDADIIEKLKNLLTHHYSVSYRIRKTNFSNESRTITLSIFNRQFREELKRLGMPVGKKSLIIKPPKENYCKIDYWRGIVDGDGSLGFTAAKFPFLSLCTDSENIAVTYEKFISSITGKYKILKRNKRDNVYNIVVFKEDAQKVTKELYYDNCLGIDRKIKLSKQILSWQRPTNMEKRDYRCQFKEK